MNSLLTLVLVIFLTIVVIFLISWFLSQRGSRTPKRSKKLRGTHRLIQKSAHVDNCGFQQPRVLKNERLRVENSASLSAINTGDSQVVPFSAFWSSAVGRMSDDIESELETKKCNLVPIDDGECLDNQEYDRIDSLIENLAQVMPNLEHCDYFANYLLKVTPQEFENMWIDFSSTYAFDLDKYMEIINRDHYQPIFLLESTRPKLQSLVPNPILSLVISCLDWFKPVTVKINGFLQSKDYAALFKFLLYT